MGSTVLTGSASFAGSAARAGSTGLRNSVALEGAGARALAVSTGAGLGTSTGIASGGAASGSAVGVAAAVSTGDEERAGAGSSCRRGAGVAGSATRVSDACGGSGSRLASVTGAAGWGGVVAAVRLSGSAEDGCHTLGAGRDGGGPCIAERPRYQSTKAPCDTASTSSNHTMDASTPGGTGIPSTRRAVLLPRCLRTGGHSSSAGCGAGRPRSSLVAVPAGSAMPGGSSLRAQCRQ
ncbi:hypothetical protein C7T35_26640 [Variovorax sp. WS11]|uniref:hypothetical protein n=1 Tax=Variovorax sp. WS11 TaxID=1105204 RepID=UPI000D0D5668|nr:hypothetical protein [Variovorax sp. WS11]NDZ14371.1 hypothetical protein [Variovorax sp. WS11]PSL81465.1 hypothetical protein C7T35_26640 [Variovorax sp. WS11]